MKNTLLTTTALALTGFAGTAHSADITAGALTMGIGGFFNNVIAYASVDAAGDTDYDGIDVRSNAEIHFSPSVVLDNGVTVGAKVELEGGSGATTNNDESYMYIKGGFGEVKIGSEDSAGSLMRVGAPDVSKIGADSTSLTAFIPYTKAGKNATGEPFGNGAAFGAVDVSNDSDANRLTYISPKFGGLHVGISYARNDNPGNGPVENKTEAKTDILDIAAQYGGAFGGMHVDASIRYGTATAATGDDPKIFGAGVKLGFGDLTVGASYGESDVEGTNADGTGFDVGASYSNGPVSYSVAYFSGSNENGYRPVATGVTAQGGFDLDRETIVLGVNYTMSSNFNVSGFLADSEQTDAGDSTKDVSGTVLGVTANFSF